MTEIQILTVIIFFNLIAAYLLIKTWNYLTES